MPDKNKKINKWKRYAGIIGQGPFRAAIPPVLITLSIISMIYIAPVIGVVLLIPSIVASIYLIRNNSTKYDKNIEEEAMKNEEHTMLAEKLEQQNIYANQQRYNAKQFQQNNLLAETQDAQSERLHNNIDVEQLK